LDAQQNLVLYEDYYEQERQALGIKKSLIESETSKNGKKSAQELTNALAEARKDQQDAFLDDAKEWVGLEKREME
jgi:hypothetical protein